MRIERIHIENFRTFRNATLARLSPLTVFVGPNGSGKSTLFDVFGFLRDSLQDNVHIAVQKRGGLKELRTRGSTGNIVLELKFREPDRPLVTYRLEVGEQRARAVVARELLQYRRGRHGQPWRFLDFVSGEGYAVVNEADYDTPNAEMRLEKQTLGAPEILAVKGLGQFEKFAAVSSFRRLIERWHLSDFHIQAARPSQEATYAEHLSPAGENLSAVAQYLFENHRDRFDQILERMKQRVPGVQRVEPAETVDGRLVLRFQDGAFQDPFIAKYVSDGTIKMFAYLVLLHDPFPHPLLCVEEPENQLYPLLLGQLLEEFRDYAHRGGQVMLSTHSPDVLNAAELDEVIRLEKRDGATEAVKLSEDETVRLLVREGDQLGSLWKQGLLGGAF